MLTVSYMVTKLLGVLKLQGLPFQIKVIEIVYKMYFKIIIISLSDREKKGKKEGKKVQRDRVKDGRREREKTKNIFGNKFENSDETIL